MLVKFRPLICFHALQILLVRLVLPHLLHVIVFDFCLRLKFWLVCLLLSLKFWLDYLWLFIFWSWNCFWLLIDWPWNCLWLLIDWPWNCLWLLQYWPWNCLWLLEFWFCLLFEKLCCWLYCFGIAPRFWKCLDRVFLLLRKVFVLFEI